MSKTTRGYRIDVDSNRDGEVDVGEPGRWAWEWGDEGKGAIAVCDFRRQRPERQLTRVVVRDDGAPAQSSFSIGVSGYAADFVVVHLETDDGLVPVLGSLAGGTVRAFGELSGSQAFLLEPTSFPNANFDGLIELTVTTITSQGAITSDRTVVRVAPWIMTPNTCEPAAVYVVAIPGPGDWNNDEFIEGLRDGCSRAGVALTEVTVEPTQDGDIDRWIQDELEFGYSAGPGGLLIDTVVDGPRNRPLDALAVMSRQVVESAHGWGSDCGVVPVVIVEVDPAG